MYPTSRWIDDLLRYVGHVYVIIIQYGKTSEMSYGKNGSNVFDSPE